jgi:hypothetical protein
VPSADETPDWDRGRSISAEKLEDAGEFVPSRKMIFNRLRILIDSSIRNSLKA